MYIIYIRERYYFTLVCTSKKVVRFFEAKEDVQKGYGGASLVKWTQKVLMYLKTVVFWVKRLKVVVRCCLYVTFFMVTSIVL